MAGIHEVDDPHIGLAGVLSVQTPGVLLQRAPPRYRHGQLDQVGRSKLAASEVRVLLALAQARAQTLERWQLMVQLSPDGEDISNDSLQNRLSQLRKEMSQCGVEGESIKALRGMGYRLCVPLVVV